jgi:hypothetical protein
MAGEPERQRGCRPSCSGRPLVEGIASIDLFVVPTIAFHSCSRFSFSATNVGNCCGLR